MCSLFLPPLLPAISSKLAVVNGVNYKGISGKHFRVRESSELSVMFYEDPLILGCDCVVVSQGTET